VGEVNIVSCTTLIPDLSAIQVISQNFEVLLHRREVYDSLMDRRDLSFEIKQTLGELTIVGMCRLYHQWPENVGRVPSRISDNEEADSERLCSMMKRI
jgi:hypothetical protein